MGNAVKLRNDRGDNGLPMDDMQIVMHCVASLHGWQKRMMAEYKATNIHVMAALEAYAGMHEATADDEVED